MPIKISEDEFVLPVAALIDMVEQGDFAQVEHLAETIAQRARLRQIEARADEVGVVLESRE